MESLKKEEMTKVELPNSLAEALKTLAKDIANANEKREAAERSIMALKVLQERLVGVFLEENKIKASKVELLPDFNIAILPIEDEKVSKLSVVEDSEIEEY